MGWEGDLEDEIAGLAGPAGDSRVCSQRFDAQRGADRGPLRSASGDVGADGTRRLVDGGRGSGRGTVRRCRSCRHDDERTAERSPAGRAPRPRCRLGASGPRVSTSLRHTASFSRDSANRSRADLDHVRLPDRRRYFAWIPARENLTETTDESRRPGVECFPDGLATALIGVRGTFSISLTSRCRRRRSWCSQPFLFPGGTATAVDLARTTEKSFRGRSFRRRHLLFDPIVHLPLAGTNGRSRPGQWAARRRSSALARLQKARRPQQRSASRPRCPDRRIICDLAQILWQRYVGLRPDGGDAIWFARGVALLESRLTRPCPIHPRPRLPGSAPSDFAGDVQRSGQSAAAGGNDPPVRAGVLDPGHRRQLARRDGADCRRAQANRCATST